MAEDRSAQGAAVAALAARPRRRRYGWGARGPQPERRGDRAGALGVPRPTAAFPPGRLGSDGRLDLLGERPTGRTGPGAGGPAKPNRRSDASVPVSLPE